MPSQTLMFTNRTKNRAIAAKRELDACHGWQNAAVTEPDVDIANRAMLDHVESVSAMRPATRRA
ncbi:MAG: hypothetical protein J2P17_02955, partial [Mycobacterium sp.]|nr:hypothetical protein [Mycobacterium sp.]